METKNPDSENAEPTETPTETPPDNQKNKTGKARRFFGNPLYLAASLVWIASLTWTTYSVLDFMGIGIMAITIAATLDIIWLVVMFCVHHNVPLLGSRRNTEIIGWVMVGVVVVILFWHGKSLNGEVFNVAGLGSDEPLTGAQSWVIAVLGPILPIGSKILWAAAISYARDSQAIAPEDKDLLDAGARNLRYTKASKDQEAAQRRIEREEAQRIQAEKDEEERLKQERIRADDERKHEETIAKLEQEAREAKAQAEANLEKLRAEHEAELEQLRAQKRQEIEKERLEAEIKLERLEAKTKLELETIRASSQLAIEQGQTYHDVRVARIKQKEELEAHMPLILSSGDSVPPLRPELVPVQYTDPQVYAEKRHRAVVSSRVEDLSPEENTKTTKHKTKKAKTKKEAANFTYLNPQLVKPAESGLSESQERLRKMSIDFHAIKRANPRFTQRAFAKQMGVSHVQVSRAVNRFPESSVLESVEKRIVDAQRVNDAS